MKSKIQSARPGKIVVITWLIVWKEKCQLAVLSRVRTETTISPFLRNGFVGQASTALEKFGARIYGVAKGSKPCSMPIRMFASVFLGSDCCLVVEAGGRGIQNEGWVAVTNFFFEVIQGLWGDLDGIERKSISEGVNEEKALPAVSVLKKMELDDTDSEGGGLQYVGDGKECVCPLVAVLVISRVVGTDGLIFPPELYTEREKMRNDLDSTQAAEEADVLRATRTWLGW
jgi:hypothetical protein